MSVHNPVKIQHSETLQTGIEEVSTARMRASALVWPAVLVVAAAAGVHFLPRGGICCCPHLMQLLCVFLGALGIIVCIILKPAACKCVH